MPLRINNMQTYVLCSDRVDLSAYSNLGNWEEILDFSGKEYTISITLNDTKLAVAEKII